MQNEEKDCAVLLEDSLSRIYLMLGKIEEMVRKLMR